MISISELKTSRVALSYSDGFSAPEQIQGRVDRIGTHTDIYSVGASLYYALTGKLYSNNFDEIEMNVDDSELMKVLTNTIHPKLKGKIILWDL